MNTHEERRAANDQKVADDIRQYGCHVISVFDPDGREPFFSYSVGIQGASGVPEAIVVGLKPSLGASLINAYNRQVRAGARFVRGVLYPDFLEGFSVYIEPARPKLLREYTTGCDRYYDGGKYEVVQIVWPSTKGVWPWAAAASEAFRHDQPMLGRVRPNRP